ncbi:MAG TPA: hypothetical protein VMX33_03155 [bacterium]|nr:hypothetical protein [bacterium]
MKPRKTGKIPPLFRKPIAEKEFEKKFLRFIELPKDQELLRSSFVLSEGLYRLKDGLDPAVLKRLGVLAKAIKANRGIVKIGPLALSTVFAACLVVFALVFMNPLMEGAIEYSLSAAFEARAEVTGFRFDPFRMRIGMVSIKVADRDKPMTNLFETGHVALRLNPSAMLRGKVYIEEASAASVLFGTTRAISGALPGYQQKAKPPMAPREAGIPLIDLQNFSAQALLDREKAKLKSNQAYEDAAAAYTEAVARWRAQSESASKSVTELKTSSAAVLSINVKSLKSVEAVSAALQEVRAAITSVKAVGQQTGDVVKGLQTDMDKAAALERLARTAAADDLKRLKSYIDPRSGAAMEALEPSLKEILSDSAERYLDYGARALEIAMKMKKDGTDRKAVPRAVSARGRDIRYPAWSYPAFRLGLFGADFTVDGTRWRITLKELSNDPDLVPEPVSLAVSVSDSVRELAFTGVADLRDADKESFVVDLTAKGLPVDLGSALKDMGVGGFTGTASCKLHGAGIASGSVSAKSEIRIADGRLREPSGTIAQATQSVGSINVDVDYVREGSGSPRFAVTTNLNDLVSAALAATTERYARKAETELDAAFKNHAGTELERKLGARDGATTLLAAARGDKTAADSLGASLDTKKSELENRASALAKDAAADVLKNVEIPTLKF